MRIRGTYQEHCLEVIRLCAARELETRGLADMAEVAVFETVRGLVVELHAYIAGRKTRGTEIRYPVTWWDAFKARWFPRWALRRRPARWRVITPEMTELFPDVRPIHGQRSVVLVEFTSRDEIGDA